MNVNKALGHVLSGLEILVEAGLFTLCASLLTSLIVDPTWVVGKDRSNMAVAAVLLIASFIVLAFACAFRVWDSLVEKWRGNLYESRQSFVEKT